MSYTAPDAMDDIIDVADKTICKECKHRNECWCEDEVDFWNLTICVVGTLRESVGD